MKQLFLCLLVAHAYVVIGQSIDSAEYFFDTDPGVGNGTSLSVNANSGALTQSFTVDISSLSNGFHDLYIRTFNNSSNWSLYDRSTFYISSINSGQNIINAEYFYDIDNGVGTGTNLDVDPETSSISQQFAIPTTGLDEGFHILYIRTQIADGTSSLYDKQVIYIKDFDNTPSAITGAEYFIDSDPGIGMGEAISITGSPQVINFDSTGLADGDHLFCIRVQNADGTWSLFDCELFNIDNSLGLNESLFQAISLSPMPFNSVVNISADRGIEFQAIKVYDMSGKTVYTSAFDTRQINLSQLEQGVYILALETNDRKATFKIVKN